MKEDETKREHGANSVLKCANPPGEGERFEQCSRETPSKSDTTEVSSSIVTMNVEFDLHQWKVVSNLGVVQEIEIQARQLGLSITHPTYESSTVKIVGTVQHVIQAKERFEDLKKHILVSSKTLHYSPGLWTVLKSMKDSIRLFEHDCNVSINIKAVPSNYSDTDSGPSRVVFVAQISECNVEICFGNFVQHPSASTMINLVVQNIDQHHLPELIEAGGKQVFSDIYSRVKELSSCVLPQVFETKPRSLSVQKLINCMVLKWNPNDKKTAAVLEEGLSGAMISSSRPCVVINQSAPIKCPPVVLVDIITRAIETNSDTLAGFTFALYVKTKEGIKSIGHFFKDRHVRVTSNNPYDQLEHLSGDDSDMYINALESDLFSFFSVAHGNLLEQKVQVYVNSTNSDLDLSRGVLSKQLLKLMGQKLQDHCNEYAPLATGKVAVTSAEKMFCNVILHVNLPSYGVKGPQRVFKEAMQNILQICLDQSLTSIAIPSLGTGKLGYPHHLVADVVISEVLGFNEKHPKFFKKVVLVLSERHVYEKCMKIYAEKLLTSTSEKVRLVVIH
jgi:O-acetyl-ADP-ribose deacetylase (regulator of RNase III)